VLAWAAVVTEAAAAVAGVGILAGSSGAEVAVLEGLGMR